MKIAILTLPLYGNYGGIIQNYAMQCVLKQMGHEPITLNLHTASFGQKHDIPLMKWILLHKKSRAKRHIRRFINENIQLTTPVCTKKDLRCFDLSSYGAVIVGSDQVWRACYTYPDLYAYYLDFVSSPTIKKIAFSASLGSDKKEYTAEQAERCGELIQNFDLITVRENGGLSLINDVYNWRCKNAPVQTLDPTMLLPKEEYLRIASAFDDDQNNGDLFYYILDMTEEKRTLVNKLAAELGVTAFTVSRKTRKWYANPKDREVPPLEKWLMAFHKAKYVLTDSFHGSVFSIIFNKEFVALGNKKRGMDRFCSLTNLFKLQDRMVLTAEECTTTLLKAPIDWNGVNAIMEAEKARSLDILIQSLQE